MPFFISTASKIDLRKVECTLIKRLGAARRRRPDVAFGQPITQQSLTPGHKENIIFFVARMEKLNKEKILYSDTPENFSPLNLLSSP